MNRTFDYQISFEQQDGRQPPANTPQKEHQTQEIISNIPILFPVDQKYYTIEQIKEILKKDIQNHPLVIRLKHLTFRKPIIQDVKQINVQQQIRLERKKESPQITQKKQEIIQNLDWYNDVNQQSGELKELKFRLNQLADENQHNLTPIIIQLILKNLQLGLILLIDKASHEDKYRKIYSNIFYELEQQKSVIGFVNKQIVQFISNHLEENDLQQTLADINIDDQGRFLIKRKKKYIGCILLYILDIKLYSQLFLDQLLDIKCIQQLIIYLINQYLQLRQNILFPEEPIEGFLELISYIKDDILRQQSKQDKENEQNFIKTISNKKLWEQGAFNISKDGLRQILKCLDQTSERVNLLIENLIQNINQGWVNCKQTQKRKRRDNKGQKRLESQESSDSDNELFQPKNNLAPKLQLLVNLEHIKEEEQEFSAQKQLQLKDIPQLVVDALKSKQPYQELSHILLQINQQSAIELYIRTLIHNIRQITKENCQKSLIVTQIQKNYCQKVPVVYVINELNLYLMDILYNASESPFGIEFIKNLLGDIFLQDINTLNLLDFQEVEEDLQQFLINILSSLFTANYLSQENRAQVLFEFVQSKLKLSITQQQELWDKIK